jgi:lysophospholipase L1-like esterase
MVSSLFRYLVDINKFQSDVVLLQIGSNDVGNRKLCWERRIFYFFKFTIVTILSKQQGATYTGQQSSVPLI